MTSQDYLSPSVLVTGGAGFIGSHIVRSLLSHSELQNLIIVVLDDLSGGFRENLPFDDRVKFICGSITDDTLIDQIFTTHNIRYVYHLAAYAAEGLSHFIRRFNYTNNVIGSMNLINASIRHDVQCFVFTSSIAVYGKSQVPMTEHLVPLPEDPYGIAKYTVELDLQTAYRMFGLEYVIFRPHNVYGEYQNLGDKYRNVIGIFMNQIMSDQPMTIFGNGEQQRAFSYIKDIAPIIAGSPLYPEARQGVFNIGADKPHSVNELATLVRDAMNVPTHPIRHLPARLEVEIAYSDHTACHDVFGQFPSTELCDGIRKMADWAKVIGMQCSAPFQDIEITKNLPPSWRNTTSSKDLPTKQLSALPQ